MDEQRFTRIHFHPKKESLELAYEVENGTGRPDVCTIASSHPPHADFIRALAALGPHAIGLCELTGVGPDDIEVRTVHLSEKDEETGIKITVRRALKKSPEGMTLNTPLKWISSEEEKKGDQLRLLDDDAADLIRALTDEAHLFLNGKRGPKTQHEMKLEGKGAVAPEALRESLLAHRLDVPLTWLQSLPEDDYSVVCLHVDALKAGERPELPPCFQQLAVIRTEPKKKLTVYAVAEPAGETAGV